MKLEDVEKLLKLIEDSDITEFELENEGSNIRIIRQKKKSSFSEDSYAGNLESSLADQYGVLTSGISTSSEVSPATQEAKKSSIGVHEVDCPIVGTFYTKPSPDSETFVKVGDKVSKGDTLCIVEAMKLMNEIAAPVSGTIEEILVEDGSVVEFGEILFTIKT